MIDTTTNPIEAFDCPLGHTGSMHYMTNSEGEIMVFRVSKKADSTMKKASCAECGLILDFIDDAMARK